MVRRIMCMFLFVVLSVCLSVPAFAFMASSSDSDWIGDDGEVVVDATPADAEFDVEGVVDRLLEPVPFNAGYDPHDYVTTVDISKVTPILQYKTTTGQTTYSYGALVKSKDGSYGTYSFPKPYNWASTVAICFRMYSGALPPSGNYRYYAYGQFTTDFQAYMIFPIVGAHFASAKAINNAVGQQSSIPIEYYQNSEDTSWMVDTKISIGTPKYLDLWFFAGGDAVNKLPFGTFSALFEVTNQQTDYTTAGGGTTSADNQQIVADSSQQVVQNTASMADTLKEIVQTISNQLAALWDQMYNMMHLKQLANDDKNTNLIINKLSEDLNVQIQNDDDNTNTIINGYDKSEISSGNDRLSDSLQGQQDVEEQILDQVSKPLNDFTFSNPITQYLDTFRMFGDFLQNLFVSSGSMKNVINLSFLMSIALIVAGLYRFKGGN